MQTFYLTQSQYTDTGPTSSSADPLLPGAWQGSRGSAIFSVTGSSALEVDALTTRPTRLWIKNGDTRKTSPPPKKKGGGGGNGVPQRYSWESKRRRTQVSHSRGGHLNHSGHEIVHCSRFIRRILIKLSVPTDRIVKLPYCENWIQFTAAAGVCASESFGIMYVIHEPYMCIVKPWQDTQTKYSYTTYNTAYGFTCLLAATLHRRLLRDTQNYLQLLCKLLLTDSHGCYTTHNDTQGYTKLLTAKLHTTLLTDSHGCYTTHKTTRGYTKLLTATLQTTTHIFTQLLHYT